MKLIDLKKSTIAVIRTLINHLLTTLVVLCVMIFKKNSIYMSAIKFIVTQLALVMSSFAPVLRSPVEELDGNKIWGIYEIFKLFIKACESLFKQDALSYGMLITCLCYFHQYQAAAFLVQYAAISSEIAKVAIEIAYLTTNFLAFVFSLGNRGSYKQTDSMLYLVSLLITSSAQPAVANLFGLSESLRWLQKNYLKEVLGSVAVSALSQSVFGRQEEYYKPKGTELDEMWGKSCEQKIPPSAMQPGK